MTYKLRLSGAVLCLLAALRASAVNPIVQTIYTADPAPFVYKDTVYLYTGHDEDKSKYFTMKDWHVFSTHDMVNWTDLGSPLSIKDFAWVKDDAWAGQAIERDGKFFWYVPVTQKTGGMAIGVAVGDSPVGPFRDALGKPLVHDGYGDIDPTVFIDKDGQAYLGWGNPTYKYVRLNKDMVSFDTSVGDKGIFRSAMTVAEFGARADAKRATSYEEGPWLYERKGIYYNIFAAGPLPEHLAYSTAPTPGGPWKYGGIVMETQKGSAFTNHPGVIDYKGKTYLFYHNAMLPGGGGFDRSVALEELKFNPDGSIQPAVSTHDGPSPVATLNPYQRTEAETIAWETGIKVVPSSAGGQAVVPQQDASYILVRNVDFASHSGRLFTASVLQESGSGHSIELRVDRMDGPGIGTLAIPNTAGKWKDATAHISPVSGVHDLYLIFRQGKDTSQSHTLLDWWKFSR